PGGSTSNALPLEIVAPHQWFVDDDAPGDPAPNDPNVSDPVEDGSSAHPFDRIQEALDSAQPRDEVLVLAGFYEEDLFVHNGDVLLRGAGEGLTTVRSQTGALLSAPDPGSPWYVPPLQLGLRDLSLESGQIYEQGPIQLSMQRATLTDVDIRLSAKGVSSLRLDALHMTRGAVTLPLSQILEVMPIVITSLDGPETPVNYNGGYSLFGPGTPLTLADSTVSALSYGLCCEDIEQVSVRNTTFTGAGISSLTTLCWGNFTVDRSRFLDGGIQMNQGVDFDCGLEAELNTSVTRSRFMNEGMIYRGAHRHVAVNLDANWFHGTGFDGTIRCFNDGDPNWSTSGAISVTNNLFECAGDGVRAEFGSNFPGQIGTPDLQMRLVNNTFSGCGTSATVDSSNLDPNLGYVASRISNNIIAGGDTGIEVLGGATQQLTVTANDLFDSATAGYAGDITDQTGLNGNISADPLFVDGAAGDFRLQPSSPAIDAGDPNAPITATDLSGAPRVLDGDGDGVAVVDMGALEFDPALVPRDDDGDGYCAAGTDPSLDPGACPLGADDCDDSDPDTHPGALDLPGDSLDRNCDGTVTCDPSGEWTNRGQFVRCVSRECASLRRQGEVTGRTCGQLLREITRTPLGGEGRGALSRPVSASRPAGRQ
ncbi:MAG TPA: choice-of-anchor Q domain-containing protein, partial [Candidatus Saccharimonadales bacterium]|nr:choice-of-anchor Q domain-containing protein [Candidatus Saccharimonadales bacterium]